MDVFYDMGVIGVMVMGCNDIVIDGKKFFGNVMYICGGKIFCYGILMYNVNMDVVVDVLLVLKDKIELKGIKLVCLWVINIMFYLKLEF